VEFHTSASRLQIPFMWQKGHKESSAYEEHFYFTCKKGWNLHFLCFILEDCSSFEIRQAGSHSKTALKVGIVR